MRGRQPKKSRPSSAELRLIQQVMARTPKPASAGQAESPVTSVAGKTGDVALTKADVGLSNVENTSDASKPVSTATQTALNAKAASGHNHAGVYEPAGVLANHEATFSHGGNPSWGAIGGTLASQTDLQTALDGKAASGHAHDLTYSVLGHNHDSAYAAAAHNHDAAYSAIGHNHTGTYEPANANLQAHVAQAHAPANAQKNSDILKSEIEAVLTGEINSHTHAGGGSSPWTVVKKTANEARTANINLTADNTLVVALSAATRYRIYINVMLTTANANMDYKYDCNYTGTLTSIHSKRKHAAAGAVAGTDVENTLASAAIVPSTAVAATTTGVAYVEIEVNILTLLAGTFQFRWAQNTSDVAALTVLAGSYLEYMTV